MPRVKSEKEIEVDVSKLKESKEEPSIAQRWFDEHTSTKRDPEDNTSNREDMLRVSELTDRMMRDNFHMNTRKRKASLYAVMFYAIMTVILDFIKSQQSTYSNFTLQIANCVYIGYTNNTNENNEKVGNFMPFMQYIGEDRNIVDVNHTHSDKMDRATKLYLRWMELNTKQNVEYYKTIQENAASVLYNDYAVNVHSTEMIIPTFCIFLDNVINVLKLHWNELEGTDVSEVKMDVLGLFTCYYSFDEEENREIIDFQPNITMKLALKSDKVAAEQS